jgi:hypothetical protein
MKALAHILALFAFAGISLPGATLIFGTSLQPELPGTTGSGSAMAEFDTVAHTLVVSADWTGLTGTTTVAHIHCCVDPPGTVGVAVTPTTLPGFPAGTTSGSYTSPVLDLTDPATYTAGFLNNFGGGSVGGAEAALLTGLQAGRAYFNVHSSFAPGGEIRGFLHQVPEPATFAFAGAALTGLLLSRRFLSR